MRQQLYKFMLLLLLCFAVQTNLLATETTEQISKPLKIEDGLDQFNSLLAQFNRALRIHNPSLANSYLKQAEKTVLTLRGEDFMDAQAALALGFAKIGNTETAKYYQQGANRSARGSAINLLRLEKLAESFVYTNDGAQLTDVYKKAIDAAPTNQKRPIKIAYVNSLYDVNENVKAATLLTELYSDVPLTAQERAEILSLLIVNSIKLNQQQRLAQYYNELLQLNVPPTAIMILAKGMYQEHTGEAKEAIKNYQRLYQAFINGKREIVYLDGVLQLANVSSKYAEKDKANCYFSLVARALPKPYHNSAIGIRYLNLFRIHELRFHTVADKETDATLKAKDSIFKNELITATKELNYKYKIEKDKQKAELFKKQQALDAALYAKNKQRGLLIIACLSLLLLGGGAMIYTLQQRRKQSNLLHLSEVERLKQWHKTEIVKKLSASQEQERWRIADQLHDEVGSMISVVRLNLSEHPLKDEVISPEKLATANRILENVAFTVREMSHQLMPVAIRQYGLIKSIEQLINDINTAGKLYIEHLIYGFEDVSKYPEDFQVSFYRIVQELFQNIVKHSKATNAIFQLVEHPDSINLYIEDNGKGIEEGKGLSNGKGISLLANRIDYYEGKISIEGQPGKGTLIVIDIPTEHLFS